MAVTVTCPKCEKQFPLRWNIPYEELKDRFTHVPLEITTDRDGYVDYIGVRCPHCAHEEEI